MRISEARAAKYTLVGFEMALEEVRKHSYTGNRISELFSRLEVVRAALAGMAKKEKRC